MQNSDDRDGRKPYKTYRAKGARRTPLDEELAGGPSPRQPRGYDERQQPSTRPKQRPGDTSAPYKRYAAASANGEPRSNAGAPRPPRRRGRRRWWILPAALALILAIAAIVGVVLAWPGYKQFDTAVDQSNQRLAAGTPAKLTPDDGHIVRNGTTVLLLGVDSWNGNPGRSDTIMLMRFNPDTGTINQLSIPRDTRVQLPNGTYDKINAANFWGGSEMAVETIEKYVGTEINHVMVVNFKGFSRLVNAVGGIDVKVPKTISTVAGKDQHPVTFKKGLQHMNGTDAMLYVRIRYADDDLHRAERQQQFVQALQKKIATPSNVPKLPAIGSSFMDNVATDLTTNEILALGYLKWRSDGGKKAVLAGEPGWEGGVSYILPPSDTKKREIVKQFLTN